MTDDEIPKSTRTEMRTLLGMPLVRPKSYMATSENIFRGMEYDGPERHIQELVEDVKKENPGFFLGFNRLHTNLKLRLGRDLSDEEIVTMIYKILERAEFEVSENEFNRTEGYAEKLERALSSEAKTLARMSEFDQKRTERIREESSRNIKDLLGNYVGDLRNRIIEEELEKNPSWRDYFAKEVLELVGPRIFNIGGNLESDRYFAGETDTEDSFLLYGDQDQDNF